MDQPPYTIEQLLDDRNRPLYEDVNQKTPVVLVRSNDGDWGAEFGKDGKFYLHCAPIQNPQAAATHELLHGRYDPMFPRPLFANEGPGLPGRSAGLFIGQLHNDLLHHRTYPVYKQMGYPPAAFLGPDDATSMKRRFESELPALERKFEQTKKPIRTVGLASLYMMARNPHDEDAGHDFGEYRNRITDIAHPQLVAGLESMLADWQDGKETDMRRLMARFFKAAGYYEIAFGTESDFVTPDSI